VWPGSSGARTWLPADVEENSSTDGDRSDNSQNDPHPDVSVRLLLDPSLSPARSVRSSRGNPAILSCGSPGGGSDSRLLPGPSLTPVRSCRGSLGFSGLGFSGLGCSCLGFSGLGFSGLGFSGLGFSCLGFSGLGFSGLGFSGSLGFSDFLWRD